MRARSGNGRGVRGGVGGSEGGLKPERPPTRERRRPLENVAGGLVRPEDPGEGGRHWLVVDADAIPKQDISEGNQASVESDSLL